MGGAQSLGALDPPGDFPLRFHSQWAAVMSVKSWNTFCKKINKERIEVEIMSPWKPEGEGVWGWYSEVPDPPD